MGNKHGKDKNGGTDGKHPILFDVNATGAQVYPIALKEKDIETKAELFRHAALCYREEKEDESAAQCYILAGENFVQIDEITEASDMYIEAMTSYSRLGAGKFDQFKDAADEALSLVGRSKYETRLKSCRDKIGQCIIRMIDNASTGDSLGVLIRSGVINRYLKGDYYVNGLKKLLEKLKEFDVTDMLVWALVYKTAVDYYVGLFVLDSSLDDELGTYTSCAVLCAYLLSLQPPPKARKKSLSPKQSLSSRDGRSVGGENGDENSDEHNYDKNNDKNNDSLSEITGFYEQPPDYKELIEEFKSINVFKRVCNQICHNIITACQAGDLDAINEQFHELYFVRRKNKYKLLEELGEIFEKRFRKYIEKGFIKAGTWVEKDNILPPDPLPGNNSQNGPQRDIAEDLL